MKVAWSAKKGIVLIDSLPLIYEHKVCIFEQQKIMPTLPRLLNSILMSKALNKYSWRAGQLLLSPRLINYEAQQEKCDKSKLKAKSSLHEILSKAFHSQKLKANWGGGSWDLPVLPTHRAYEQIRTGGGRILSTPLQWSLSSFAIFQSPRFLFPFPSKKITFLWGKLPILVEELTHYLIFKSNG